MSTETHWPCPNSCHLWARIDAGKTNHHPRCEFVDESLIDVWKVCIPGESEGCICDTEEAAKAFIDGDPEAYEITKIKMHREAYENLSEFNGF